MLYDSSARLSILMRTVDSVRRRIASATPQSTKHWSRTCAIRSRTGEVPPIPAAHCIDATRAGGRDRRNTSAMEGFTGPRRQRQGRESMGGAAKAERGECASMEGYMGRI